MTPAITVAWKVPDEAALRIAVSRVAIPLMPQKKITALRRRMKMANPAATRLTISECWFNPRMTSRSCSR